MTAELFSPTDPDWALHQSNNEAYLIKVASDRIRNYLGWHLAPVITEVRDLALGERGLVMLPSRHVTNVESVKVLTSSPTEDDGQVVSSKDFWFSEDGWLELRSRYYGWPGKARVTFTHGYAEVPADVKEVAFELVKSSAGGGLPIGTADNVQSLSSPGGYSIQFKQNTHATIPTVASSLSHDQAVRLANYRILGDF